MSYANTCGHSPYPSYKLSGVSWLGEVPVHWELRRLGDSVGGCINGIWGENPDSINDLACIRVADFDRKQWRVGLDKLTMRAVTPKERSHRLLKPGDLLVEKSGGGDNQPVGVVVLYDHDLDAVTSNFVGKFEVKDGYHPKYLTLLHATLYALEINKRSIKQTTGIQNIDISSYLSELVSYPPLDEQAAIVQYLDNADQRIRAYVSVKERLIALLEEERQALVHQAVTRGLDPNVRLKPSGVEWLGDVPEHWEVRRIRTLGQAIIGLTYSPQDVVDEDEGRLVLRASNISGGRLVDADNVYVRCPVPDKLVTSEGDILICSRSGSRNLIGKNAQIDSKSAGVTFGAFMTIMRGQNNDYLHQVFNSKLFEHQSGAFLTSTINQLTLGILNDMRIPFPPEVEQQNIIQYLKKATENADATIDRARHQIDLMNEYRTRLIADVVTGKLDVRTASEPLPNSKDGIQQAEYQSLSSTPTIA